MKTFLNILASVFLLFNGIGALYGGWNLMLYPDGSSIQLSMDWLRHTPFVDYRIPGFILFIANGLLSAFASIALLLNIKQSPWLVIAQGAILTGWILVQILLIQTIYFLHFICVSVGIALIIVGWILVRYSRKPIVITEAH